ncbi:putative zinc-binding metallopeptidase [Odoribacter sp. OttesenSCG-928-A06]|nr:putative zinc-binding metallopeptidase [Odoribacter sp. OttesenSCG-928-A06]
MNKLFLYIAILVASLVVMSSCDDDDMTSGSIYDGESTGALSKTDQWLLDSFVGNYNIQVLYRWADMESDLTKYLTPPHEDTVIPFMKVMKKVWLDVYIEIATAPGVDGGDIMKPLFPKQLMLVGSRAWNDNGSETQGMAEGGRKITITAIDHFNPKQINDVGTGNTKTFGVKGYTHTLHHEFAHILNQKKDYNKDAFQAVTPEGYTANWGNASNSKSRGFVTNYAMAAPEEDFVEVLSKYVTMSAQEWEKAYGDGTGSDLIAQKLSLVRTYFTDSWNIDIDRLRMLTLGALDEVARGNY